MYVTCLSNGGNIEMVGLWLENGNSGVEKINFHGGKSLLVFFVFGFLIMLIRLNSKAGHPGIP